ncbi:2951_t:CDS:1 [Ambispora gerdemannii]|uniref:2951_t:CDS:1 n=1 Tax=Ambispora gerdemannii TaxID=144530 RepID=A0A9N9BBX2_9GLOM|nr:2951_t:CDS:1 [Ambispora gerdemannii]
MAQSLTPDCLSEIFGYLTDNKQALHSCILVNRIWCETSIPILWRQPFRLLYSHEATRNSTEETRQIKATKLLQIYFAYLTPEQINDLDEDQVVKYNIKTESGVESAEANASALTFQYITYLRCLDLVDIHAAVRDWIEYTRRQQIYYQDNVSEPESTNSPLISLLKYAVDAIIFLIHLLDCCRCSSNDSDVDMLSDAPSYDQMSIEYDEQKLSTKICELLIGRCNSVKRLSIDVTAFENRSLILGSSINEDGDVPRWFLSVPIYANAQSCFSQLTEFTCIIRSTSTDIFREMGKKTDLFRELAKISRYIQRIVVHLPTHRPQVSCLCSVCSQRLESEVEERTEEVKSLADLISKQNDLKEIDISCGIIGSKELMESIASRSISLKRLLFTNTKFYSWAPLEELRELVNIEELTFRSCHGLTEEIMKPLMDAPFARLKHLDMDNTSAPTNILESIIISCGASIQRLNLGSYIHPNPDASQRLIQSVTFHCTNLRQLNLYVYGSDMNSLATLFESLTQLESVVLAGAMAEINVDDLFSSLALIEMPQLKQFAIEAGWKFSWRSLETFLRNKKSLRVLEFKYTQCFNQRHLDAVVSTLGYTLKLLKISALASLDEDALNIARSFFDVVEIDEN